MTSFGTTLKNAREALGLTCSQVAAKTRVLPQIIEEMENEDFHRIAAPIYGRGFVRLYAECVGLDPKPLIDEFMEIYEGRRNSTAKQRTGQDALPAHPSPPPPRSAPPPPREPPRVDLFGAPAQPPAPEPVPAPAPEPDPLLRGLDLFDQPPPAPPKPAPQPAAPVATPSPHAIPPRISAPTPPPRLSRPAAPRPASRSAYESPFISNPDPDVCPPSPLDRFRSGMSNITGSVIKSVGNVPRRAWRIAALCTAVLAVLGLAVWGCSKLYSVTSTPAPIPGTESPAPAPAQSQSATPAALKPPVAPPKNLRSSGHSIPSLYAD